MPEEDLVEGSKVCSAGFYNSIHCCDFLFAFHPAFLSIIIHYNSNQFNACLFSLHMQLDVCRASGVTLVGNGFIEIMDDNDWAELFCPSVILPMEP